MANIRVDLRHEPIDGESVSFKAPCDCTAISGIIVYYPVCTENVKSTTSKVFTFKDAHGNTLTGIGNLFSTGAIVKVLLDITNAHAYIQNADTNSYIENNKLDKSGGTMTGQLVAYNNSNYTTPQVRNIIVQSTVPTSITNGVIVGVYE